MDKTVLLGVIIGVATGVIGNTIYDILKDLNENRNRLRTFILTSTVYRRKDVRLSISYLYRININGKYLLVKGKRIDQFQPVGGVFKYNYSSISDLNNLGVVDDSQLSPDAKSNKDLRINVKGKNVSKLLNWFFERKGREVSIYREFNEEIVKEGIVNSTIEDFNPEYLKTHFNGIKYSQHFECYEILIAEIYNLIIDEELRGKFETCINNPDVEKFIWVESGDIKKLCAKVDGISKNISVTSKWIL